MCKKKLFSIIYPFLRGAVQKWRFFRKTFYGAFLQILVAQFAASPTTPCARPTDRNSWRNWAQQKAILAKTFVHEQLLNKKFSSNRSPALSKRFKKYFLHAFSGFFPDLNIFIEKTPQKNLDREITKIVTLCPNWNWTYRTKIFFLFKLQKTRRVVKPIENPLGIAKTTTNFFWRLK